MLNELSASDLIGWLAYYQCEPWGYEIENYRAGSIAASVLNTVRGSESDKVWTYKDFFPSQEVVEEQTEKDQIEIAKLLCSIYGKEV